MLVCVCIRMCMGIRGERHIFRHECMHMCVCADEDMSAYTYVDACVAYGYICILYVYVYIYIYIRGERQMFM
jgi:hypothetical protein